MALFRFVIAIVIFTFFSSVLSEEIRIAVVGGDNKLNITCEEDAEIMITFPDFNKKGGVWSKSFNESCPNRNNWGTFWTEVAIVALCQGKPNCSIDLSTVKIQNCTDFANYLEVKYICNTTESTTPTSTTENNSDDDDNSSEEKTTRSSKRKTPRVGGKLEPHYIPHVVPGLLTTPKPTQKPYHYPQPRLPVPALQPSPLKPTFIQPFNLQPVFGNGLNNNPPYFMPIAIPRFIPIPVFGKKK